jgi:hypothetical protein
VSARSTIAGAYSASCGTSSAMSAARPAAELGWPSRSNRRRQRRETWSRLMRGSSGCRCRRWRQAVRASYDGCDGCDGQVRTPVGSKVQQFCGLQRVHCDGQVRTSSATGCDARFAPVAAQKARDSAAFGVSRANLSATGATRRFAPRAAQNSRISAAFRLSVRRVVRTANPDSRAVASGIAPWAPRYQYSPRKDPDHLL